MCDTIEDQLDKWEGLVIYINKLKPQECFRIFFLQRANISQYKQDATTGMLCHHLGFFSNEFDFLQTTCLVWFINKSVVTEIARHCSSESDSRSHTVDTSLAEGLLVEKTHLLVERRGAASVIRIRKGGPGTRQAGGQAGLELMCTTFLCQVERMGCNSVV